MRHLILTAALLVGLAAPGCAGDRQEDPFLTPKADRPAPDWIEDALRMPPRQLGLFYLATFENTRWFEQNYANFKIIRKATTGEFTLKVGVFYPDGTTPTVILKTTEEFDQFLAKSRLLLTTYEKAITKRGFKQLAPSYHATVSQGCSDRWFTSGEVAVQQKEFMLEFSQGGNVFEGTVVKDRVTVSGFPVLEAALFGRLEQIIKLRDAQSKCRITLRAR